MRAFTIFNVKLYPIQHAEGADEAVEKSMNHIYHFQEDGILNQHFEIAPSFFPTTRRSKCSPFAAEGCNTNNSAAQIMPKK
jgi:hypothetical protein